MIRMALKWTGNVFMILLVIAIVFAGFTMIQTRRNPNYIPSALGYQPMSVLTGSMEPLLAPGDMILVKKISPEKIKVGDVITYRVDQKTLVTHRVIEVVQGDEGLMFRTKGDANNAEDHGLVPNERLVGKLSLNIPKGGYVANFARSGKGLLLFILLPAILLIVSELKTIWREADNGGKDNPKDPMGI